ncbi:MAG TPA: FAD-binding and (Fe-S)-binding domain-containing protein, partial [Bacteroidales bacterium]|nr:FAD-binding and (Fe-S)-binding domain-containing protein [Bacteroidales bacterium]
MGKLEKHIIRELAREGHSSKVFSDHLNLIARGTDAGIYRLIPKLVVQVNNEQDVIIAINVCRKAGIPVTFKAAGTSLSGQTVTDSVLLETGPLFTQYSIFGNGEKINLQPGITGGYANAVLSRYYKKIGPSPASLASAKIGGIIGNNASGASYGIATNSYNTLEGLSLVFADGSILDSLDQLSRQKFINGHQNLVSDISRISKEVKDNTGFFNKIQHKYQLKNTTGYGLNSLIDFNDPLDILWHLVIGSEGTLAFVSGATYKTVNSYPKSAAALLLLPDIREACRAIAPLLKCEVSAAELMDRNALLSVREIPGIPEIIRNPAEHSVALLIDTSAPDEDILNRQVADIRNALSDINTLYPLEFIKDLKEYNRIWKVRKGLFTSAAATRPGGTSCLIEDVAFRSEVLADALVALRTLIEQYGYRGSVMWGHLLDGNVHFVIMPDFRSQAEIEKYRKFMEDFVNLTVHEFDGSLKAEHGTGRNMAPFVGEEWGSGLYSVMKSIKKSFDPENILNPGVLLNEDPDIHIKNLKPVPVVDETIDKCIECGFCESICPSKDLTFTPRQRIVAYRELFRSDAIPGVNSYIADLKRAFSYNVDQTCATDGLCGLACPVSINTGKLVKEIR